MNLLVLTHEFPRPDVAASNRRLVDMLRLIARGHRVDMLCPAWTEADAESRYDDLYRSLGVRVFFGDGAALERRLQRRVYDFGLFEWWVAVPLWLEHIRRWQPWATIVVDAVDVCFRREEAGLALGHLDAATVAENRRAELQVYREADALLSVSDEDLGTLRAFGLESPIYFVPMIEAIHPRPSRPRDRELLFVGAFGINQANVDGVQWFGDQVWPLVSQAVPEARLTLIGSDPTPEIQALSRLPGVHVAGFVPDLKPYLERAAVSIAPLRFGGGMKGKVTEALARGLPLVTTRFGVQGLNVESGKHLIVADDPEGFANGVITLLRDEAFAESIGQSGQRFIASLCSPEVVEGQIAELLAWVEPRTRQRALSPMLRWSARSIVSRAAYTTNSGVKELGRRLTPPLLWDAMKTIKSSIASRPGYLRGRRKTS